VEGEYNGDENYIVDGSITPRPLLSSVITIDKAVFVADGIDQIIITNLPIPCIVTIINTNNNRFPIFNDEVSTGKIILTTKEPGVYRLIVDCFPYRQYITEIEATK
jgi:hypothetical protein